MDFFFFFPPKIFKKNLKKPKNRPQGGQGVGVRILFFSQNFYYLFLGAHAKIWNPTTTPSGVLNNGMKKKKRRRRIPLAPMGVLAPGSAHARPSARPPIDTSGNFPAPVFAEWPSAFKTVKIPEIFFLLESSYFCYLGAHAKIWNPTTTPSVVLNNGIKNKKKKINT